MSSERAGPDVEITPATSPERLDVRAIAALGILAWGREPAEGEIARKTDKLEAELVDLAPASRPVHFLAEASGTLIGFCRVLSCTVQDS